MKHGQIDPDTGDCMLGGLPPEMCSGCRALTDTQFVDESPLVVDTLWMKSRYESRCVQCQNLTRRGEQIYRKPNGRWVCEQCGKEHEARHD